MTIGTRTIRIGVDCGGTNTDAVIVDLTPGVCEVVLASTKTPTTPEVTHGIQTSIKTVFSMRPDIQPNQIQALSIGTTHFVNALIQRSEDRLERVAVIRLCGPFSRVTPPFVGFPYELRELLEGPYFFVDGGLQIDGRKIRNVNPAEIEAVCEEIRKQDIRAVAIASIFAPIDFVDKQEEQVEAIVHRCIPGVFTSISKKVANMGMLERENATILNAALLPFAQVTVSGFKSAAKALDLECPVFVTGNDGTILSLDQAKSLPIRTFSSGPTNSMRGASFLARLADPYAKKETALVIDVGGTTTEVGVLLPSGFPRQAASTHELCGVRLNFAMPHVSSIGLGGGSLIRQDPKSHKVLVGPDSVGYKISDEAWVFGGKTLVATDIAVAAGTKDVGDSSKVEGLEKKLVAAAKERIKSMLEFTIETMKTSQADIPVYLVGGGAILAPEELKGVSKVHRFPFFECANAVGAAVAQVAGTVDSVEVIETKTIAQAQKEVEQRAIDQAIAAGALPSTIQIVESEAIPVAYVSGKCRFSVKAAGEWGGNITSDPFTTNLVEEEVMNPVPTLCRNVRRSSGKKDVVMTVTDILNYKPQVVNGIWTLSDIDLEFIAIGAYILGCGGGGQPTHIFLAAREQVRNGIKIDVVDLSTVPKDGLLGWGGGMGSPEVSKERLLGNEYHISLVELLKFMQIDGIQGLVALEIGGANGMINMLVGSSTCMNIPVIDGDFMGRAYPTGWQTTPNVFDPSGRGEMMLPSSIASGDGDVLFMTSAKTDKAIDASLRAACVEMGTRAGHASRPLTPEFCEKAMIKNTVSLSWTLGRTVTLANKQGNVSNVGKMLVEVLGGEKTSKVLFVGKVVEVSRSMFKGHSIGKVVVAAVQPEADDEAQGEQYEGTCTIPFKNENLYAEHNHNGKRTILASVPDLIAVLDAGNGHALGTPDFKFGQRVFVLGITAAPQWTNTERGLELGSAKAFGFDDVPYEALGEYVKPESVIDKYNVVV